MKKSKTVLMVSLLCVLVLFAVLYAYWRSAAYISGSQVEKIVVWKGSSALKNQKELEPEDAENFIKLYNAASYSGPATGEGGTPEFGVLVCFHNGSKLYVNDFHAMGRDFEVFRHRTKIGGKAFYLDSTELSAFVLELVEKYCE